MDLRAALAHIDEVLVPRPMSADEAAAFRIALVGPISPILGSPIPERHHQNA
jgi:hypothetical protein